MADTENGNGWQPPSTIDKVNYIIDFFMDDCSPDLTVYARAAITAGEQAIMTIADFAMDDVIREMARPKPTGAARTFRHGRRGRKGGKEGAGLLNIGENVGHDLRGSSFLPTHTDSKGLHWLWQIDGFGQRVFFVALCFGVTTDFLYTFSTILEKSVECGGYPGGIENYAINEQGILGLLGWQSILMGYPTPYPPLPGWITNPGDFWLQTGRYWALWYGTITTDSMVPVVVQFGFWWYNSILDDPDIVSEQYTVVVGKPRGFCFPAWFGPEYPAYFAARTLGGNAKVIDVRCKCVGRKDTL